MASKGMGEDMPPPAKKTEKTDTKVEMSQTS